MKISTLTSVFERAGIKIRELWSVHFNPNSQNSNEQISHLLKGYLLLTDIGMIELRYGETTVNIQHLSDFGPTMGIVRTNVLSEPCNALDTSEMIQSLREYAVKIRVRL